MWILLACCLLLPGCGERISAAEDLQQRYAQARSGRMEAEIVYHLQGESRCFDVGCVWDEKAATTTIRRPEEAAGLSATVTGEEMLVNYGGGAVSAGTADQELSPAVCIPRLLKAVASGYVLEVGEETVEGRPCLRLAFDTGTEAEPLICTVWFSPEGAPLYGEFSRRGALVLSLRTLDFQMEEAKE